MMKRRKKKKNAFTLYLERQALRQEIEKTRNTIDSARNHFEQVVDPTLIDCYIYEVQSLQMRYRFLLKRIKQIEDSYAKNPLEVSGS